MVQARAERTCKQYGFKNVLPGGVKISGHVEISEVTYIDSGQVQAGRSSIVEIGKRCNIGWNVFISSVTHPLEHPINPNAPRKESSISIEDRVWIATNILIREGIKIGDDVIIGATSAVTHGVLPEQKLARNPARVME